MRERVQLMRVSHPILGQYEADFLQQEDQGESSYIAYLTMDKIDPVVMIGERVVITWLDDPSKHARAKIEAITLEQSQSQDEWETFKLTLNLQSQSNDLRHYPRLVGGFQFLYALVDHIDNVEQWLEAKEDLSTVQKHSVFEQSIDDLLNFSVSGLSFEAKSNIDNSTIIACAILLNGSAEVIKCLAKVTRCLEILNTDSTLDHYQIAIHFISPPQILTQVLSELTLRLQRRETEGNTNEV